MGKDAYFFSHDCNARNDQKILELRSVYGYEGYGRFWALVEMMREEADYKIMLTEYVWNALALQLQCDSETAHKFVSDCIEKFHLFQSDGKAFWSTSLHRRMNVFDEKSSRRKEAAKKAAEARWGKPSTGSENGEKNAPKCERNANRMRTQCDGDAMDASKVKESKVNISTTTTEREGENDADFGTIIQEYSDNIHPISGQIESDRLMELLDRFGKGWVIAAIQRAVLRNKRSLGYIEGILKDWDTKGFDDGEAKGNGQRSARCDKPSIGKGKKSEPDWSKETNGW